MSDDKLDVSLIDLVLLSELELTATLMVAANGSDEHLTAEEIDELLGVQPPSAMRAIPVQRASSGDDPLAGGAEGVRRARGRPA